MPDKEVLDGKIINLKKPEKGKKKCPIIVIEKEILNHPAWFSLGGRAPHVYLIFLQRRRMEKIGKRGHQRMTCTNSQEIIFTYAEAKKKFGLTKRQFTRAIDTLVEVGFIDIVKQGGSLFKEETIYGLSDRWRKWGQPDFEKKSRSVRDITIGYCKPKKECGEKK